MITFQTLKQSTNDILVGLLKISEVVPLSDQTARKCKFVKIIGLLFAIQYSQVTHSFWQEFKKYPAKNVSIYRCRFSKFELSEYAFYDTNI